MTRLDTGVWETAAENAKVYDAYKYVVTGADGRVVWKADPCAFHAATVPGQTARSTTCPDTSGGTMTGGGSGWKSHR